MMRYPECCALWENKNNTPEEHIVVEWA